MESRAKQTTAHDLRQGQSLKLVFFDLQADPRDVSIWSGITTAIIHGLENAGVQVTTAGHVLPRLRRLVSGAAWHYYEKIRKLHYVPDRDLFVTKLFSFLGRSKIRKGLAGADAIVTTSTTATAFLQTDKPIFLIHDATWAQILELYPYFHASVQVPRIVQNGAEMERATFTRPNVTLLLTSQWAAARAIADYGLDPKRVFVLPFGANFAKDPPRAAVDEAIHARNGDHCNLLFVGKEFDRKGGSIAVDAAKALQDVGISVTLHVVGCSPKDLPPWVKVYGLLRKDHKTELEQLHTLYAGSDFFILPTQAEAQGIVFNEAAAYGLPVAATDVGGVSSVVANGSWGSLLPVDASGQQHALWISNHFRDRKRYIATAIAARDDYEKRLSRAAYTSKLLSIIQETLDQASVHSL